MIVRRAVVAVAVLVLLVGCAPDASSDAKAEATQLEDTLEALPGVDDARAYLNPDAVGLQVEFAVQTEDEYLDALTSVIEVWIDETERRAWFLFEAGRR